MNRFINLHNVRRADQKEIMEKIKEAAHCPFCTENVATYHKKPILKDGKYWILTDNQWPYEKIKHQILAIHKKHIEHISEITPEAGAELFELFKEEALKRKIPGGGFALRFGSNPELGTYGSTVLHLHAHLIEPDLAALGDDEAWRFKFGQNKKYKNKRQ